MANDCAVANYCTVYPITVSMVDFCYYTNLYLTPTIFLTVQHMKPVQLFSKGIC